MLVAGARRGAADRREPGRRVQRRRCARRAGDRAARARRRPRRRSCCRTQHESHAYASSSRCVAARAAGTADVLAQSLPAITVDQLANGQQTYSLSIQVLALMTALTVLPALAAVDDGVHAHRDRARDPAPGARHAADAAEPSADRSLAVPHVVRHDAGHDAGLRRGRRAVHGRRAGRDDGRAPTRSCRCASSCSTRSARATSRCSRSSRATSRSCGPEEVPLRGADSDASSRASSRPRFRSAS